MIHEVDVKVKSFLEETLISFAEAAKRLPAYRGSRRTHPATIHRWHFKGVRTPHGLARLEAIRLGGRLVTSVEALARFVAAQQAPAPTATPDADTNQVSSENSRRAQKRYRDLERVDAELEKVGI